MTMAHPGTTMTVPVLVLLLVLTLSSSSSAHHRPDRSHCIHPPCDFATLDVDGDILGFSQDFGTLARRRSLRSAPGPEARTLADLLEGLAPVAAATSSLLAGVADLGFAASNPYRNPWYGGYGGYAPGYGYGYPYGPYRPFPYFR